MSIREQVKYLRNIYQYGTTYEETKKAIEEAADTIESLSAKLQAANMERQTEDCGSGWIYCGDGKKYPQKFGRYLCTMESGEVMECSYEWNAPHTKKMFFRNHCAMNVIAWRYLPDSYHEP